MQTIKDIFELSPEDLAYRISALTPSQIKIMEQIMQGQSDKETASILGLKVDTVRTHIASACDRIGVARRSQLIIVFALWKYTTRNTATAGACLLADNLKIGELSNG